MKLIAWLKDRSPHHALNGKSPYKMKHKKVPYLGEIHEFGTTAYVKDLKARKPNAHRLAMVQFPNLPNLVQT